MKQTVKDRIIEFIQWRGLSRRAFSRMIGMPETFISSMKNGTSDENLNKIIEQFPELNKAWLLIGEGDMLKKPCKPEAPYEIQTSNYRLVPLINIDSVGGLHSENITTPSEQYLIKMIPFTEARDGDVAIIQSGNSMYPTIPPGSALLIREVVDWQQYFGYGGIFVLWLTDGRRITKEIRRYDADPKNYVWCVSYNSDVADEELPKSMIRGVWKVVKYIADFGW
jgi:hypothetical protein